MSSNSTFHETIRRYSERLNQEKELSLRYLQRISQLQGEINHKDFQLANLYRTIRELKTQLREFQQMPESEPSLLHMAHHIVGAKLTESIFQTLPSSVCSPQLNPLFEDFFIIQPHPTPMHPHTPPLNTLPPNTLPPNAPPHKKVLYCFKEGSDTLALVQKYLLEGKEDQFAVQEIGAEQAGEKEQYKTLLFINVEAQGQSNEITAVINPAMHLYGLCCVIRDTVIVGGRYYRVPFLYGFVTYYPFLNYYKEMMHSIHTSLRGQVDVAQLNRELRLFHKINISLNTTINYTFLSKLYRWTFLPEHMEHQLYHTSKVLFKHYPLEFIIDILMLLLLDMPVTLHSKDQSLLSKLIFFFVNILRPLRYTNPIFVSLPLCLAPMLRTPRVALVGTLHPVAHLCEERALFDLDQKTALKWPLVMNRFLPCKKHLKAIAERVVCNEYCMGNLGELTKAVIFGREVEDIADFWKHFATTALYATFIQSE